ncbi:PRKR-interacting protein 1 homolog [Paramacrobiotus metropolitanus]|uniref:PRKR-interacting protein 1 homolog n=1 Tax=Paramacrobiotus metropolitanus TaxID=2943436 RepID=UPI002445E7FB|nr:PRKR-interacting protein 1 homolog [Paramacrobiotus metropolitanus]
MSDSEDSNSSGRDDFKRVRGPADLQRRRLERLMKNPEKEVHIAEPPKNKPPPAPPEYVRFYMGSSAGAGSGEFHIYRNLRRKEQNRMRYIDEQAKKDDLQKAFVERVSEQKRAADKKAEKKRAKRLKKKAKKANKKGDTNTQQKDTNQEESDDSSDDSGSDNTEKPAASDTFAEKVQEETAIPHSASGSGSVSDADRSVVGHKS